MGESEPAWGWMILEVFSNFNDFMSLFTLPSLLQPQGVLSRFLPCWSSSIWEKAPFSHTPLHPEHHLGCRIPG